MWRTSIDSPHRTPRGLAPPVLVGLVGAMLLVTVGCRRDYYRRQADAEVNCLIDQKAALVNSQPETLRIDVNPRSRMFSPNDPDFPPMPPDDPVAHRFLECVDGKRGARSNRLAPRTPFVENPNWLAHMPRDEEGRLVLDLPAAVQVGLLHSPSYQGELEELYLSALDVTFERFRFDAQFFGGSSIFYTADGRVRSGTGESSSLLEVNTSRAANPFRLEKFTATGGELVVGFANSLVWQFAGPDDYTSNTLLDFSIVQPLLRRGGRTVVLERLTIAERTLLANVRSMERYRRGFYLNITTGRDPGSGPSRRGGFFGGSGLEGFTGVGGGGFGRVGGGFGGGFTGGAGAASAGGYIGLLQDGQELRNQRSNIAALRSSVDQLQASYDAGRIDRFQVDLARQALFNAQSQLLAAEADYQSTVDDFLINLGLPPDIDIRLTDPLLEPFQLRSEELTQLQADATSAAASLRADDPEQADEPAELDEQPLAEALAGPVLVDDAEEVAPPAAEQLPSDVEKLATDALDLLAAVEVDYQTLLAALPDRREHLKVLAGREEVAIAQINPRLLSPARLNARVEALRADLDSVGAGIRRIADELSASSGEAPPEELRRKTTDLSSLLLELSLLQARARLDTVDIDPTELTDDEALAIASLHRRDWKNARASLVDSWRLINFNANDLLSDLDITFSGDLGNVGDNPLRLRSTNGRLRVGLAFDTPLTRLSERNLYRQSLIEFQQARRDYYRFVDRIHQGLRLSLRQIRLNEINFELRREAVFVAITQVDLTQLRLSEPPKPEAEAQFSSTTARDLVQALGDLLSVQNDFLSVWVNNHVQLLNLEFDLGLMELDATGERIPLALPLAEFLHAAACGPNKGGPERLPADLEIPPLDDELPCQPAAPLLFTADVAQPIAKPRLEPTAKRLPPPENSR